MKAIVFDRFGEPGDVLEVREVPTPEPGPGEVRVRMIASPVNPSDLLVVRGRYGVLPTLPATPGFEGVGVVDRVGPGMLARLLRLEGKRVCAINHAGGNWAEYAVIPAKQARPVPADLPDEQVATFFVNPATVLALVRHVLAVPRGDWLLQSAANSTLGKMVVRLARHDGIRTINVVRRREAAAELESLGADVVLAAEEGPLAGRVRERTEGRGVRYAMDPVGGAIGTEVFRSLGERGKLVVYGSLSEEPIQVENRRLIAGRGTIEGFWLGHFLRGLSIPRALAFFRQVGGLIRAGVLASEIGPSFPPERIGEAVAAAEASGRMGKVLLRFD
jgi:NADPH:quinone reductase-like Zn-dependent oxidoreductase